MKVPTLLPVALFTCLILPAPALAAWQPNGNALGDGEIPRMVSDGAGGAIVTWQDYQGDYSIYAQRIDASGAVLWTASGVAVCTATGDQNGPSITSDGAGGAIVAWMDERINLNYNIYAQRVDASGAMLWTTNGVAVCTAPSLQSNVEIVSDGAGGAIMTWHDYRSGGIDIYARRIDASGVVQWTTNGVALCTAAFPQEFPRIASDGAGGAIVTWEDYRSGSNRDTYAQRINASGMVQWAANGVAVCTAANDQNGPRIVSDGIGGAIVTWFDHRSGTNHDIYAQRIDASGVVQWAGDGVALCTAASDQNSPTMVANGADGAIVTWYDYRNGTTSDIYGQWIDASGVVQWTADGVVLCTANNNQNSQKIISDHAGGAIVAWEDFRTDSDVYAQRIAPGGGIPTEVGGATPHASMSLTPNFPNPFSNTTAMELDLTAAVTVEANVYDVTGRRVRRIGTSRESAGVHRRIFDGRDDEGRPLVAGVYFYIVRAGGTTIARKIVIAR